MFKLIYRKSPTSFSLKCYYKDVGKNPIKNIENCLSYAACRFEKSYFEKNVFEVLKCVIDMNKWKNSTFGIPYNNFFFQGLDFLPHILEGLKHLLSQQKKKLFFENSTVVLPLKKTLRIFDRKYLLSLWILNNEKLTELMKSDPLIRIGKNFYMLIIVNCLLMSYSKSLFVLSTISELVGDD